MKARRKGSNDTDQIDIIEKNENIVSQQKDLEDKEEEINYAIFETASMTLKARASNDTRFVPGNSTFILRTRAHGNAVRWLSILLCYDGIFCDRAKLSVWSPI